MESLIREPVAASSGNQTEEREILAFANLTLNLANYRVTIDQEPVELTDREIEALRILLERPDRIHSYESLTMSLWGDASRRSLRHLNVLIHRLRGKLAGSPQFVIETVRGRGYGLLRAVNGAAAADLTSS